MTTLVTADLHLSDKLRDAYRHVAMKTIRGIIKKDRSIKQLVINGDLTEEKDYHSAELANAVADHIYEFSQLVSVIINCGNHDYVSIDCPFFRFLSHIKNIQWISKPGYVETETRRSFFLPHTNNWKRDWKGLDFKGYDWVFAHQTFNGAAVGFGRELEGIPLTVFPKGVQVISGDIHVPQKLGCVTYVGAPTLIDFGDSYTPRVLLIENSGKLVSIPVPGVQKRLVKAEYANGTLTIEAVS